MATEDGAPQRTRKPVGAGAVTWVGLCLGGLIIAFAFEQYSLARILAIGLGVAIIVVAVAHGRDA